LFGEKGKGGAELGKERKNRRMFRGRRESNNTAQTSRNRDSRAMEASLRKGKKELKRYEGEDHTSQEGGKKVPA